MPEHRPRSGWTAGWPFAITPPSIDQVHSAPGERAMTGRVLAALPLLILVAGCVNEPRSQFVRPTGYTQTSMPRSLNPIQRDPKNEATEKRVLAVGQKVIDANPQAGVRPVFMTFGAPHPEIFHRGGGTQPWNIFLSAGLVGRCRTDA